MNIIIPVNRKRIPHVFIISCVLVGYLFYNAWGKSKESDIEGSPTRLFYVSIILVLLYYAVIALIEYIKTLFDKNASLVITDLSIVDNLSIFSCGKILWDDVADIEIRRTILAEFLIIKVQAPYKYLQTKNIFQRQVLKQYIKKMGSPVIISNQRIRYNLQELRILSLEHKNK